MKWLVLILSFFLFAFALYLYNQPGAIILAVTVQVVHSAAFGLFLVMDYRDRWSKVKKG